MSQNEKKSEKRLSMQNVEQSFTPCRVINLWILWTKFRPTYEVQECTFWCWGRSLTTLTFCQLLTNYLPHFDLIYCFKEKYAYPISSATYLPRLVNVVKERPLARKGVQNHLSNKCKQIINSPMGGSSSLQYTIHTFRVAMVVMIHNDLCLLKLWFLKTS